MPTPSLSRGPSVAQSSLSPGPWQHTEKVLEAMRRAIEIEYYGEARDPPWRAEARVMLAFRKFERGWQASDDHQRARRARVVEWANALLEADEALQRLVELAPRALELDDGVLMPPPPWRIEGLADVRRGLRVDRGIGDVPRQLRRSDYAAARHWLAPIREGRLPLDGRPTGIKVTDLQLAHAMLEAPQAWQPRVCVDLADAFLHESEDDPITAARELAKRITRALRPQETP